MEERMQIIEENILRFLFCRSQTDSEVDIPQLKKRMIRKIEKEYGDLVSPSEVDTVLDNLISSELVEKINKKNIKLSLKGIGHVSDKKLLTINDVVELTCAINLDNDSKIYEQYDEYKTELEKHNTILIEKIKDQENKIASFYNNIVSIMAILIAAFAIIGFNIGGIKFIVSSEEVLQPWVYAGSIGVLNLCIIISLYFLFFLLNIIINPLKNVYESNKYKTIFSKKFFVLMLIIILIIIFTCFIIAYR